MKIKTFITTYNRFGMLSKVVNHLNSFGIIPQIKDDGSKYNHNIPQYFRHEHRGKDGFWITWNEILEDCKDSNSELFLFMPDDFQDLDVKRVIALHYEYTKKGAYAYNIMNYGKKGLFNNVLEVIKGDTIMCGFVDCGFFCNREALDKLGYYMDKAEAKEDSSGVGRQLSKRLLKARVIMYKPVKSLGYHDGHTVSEMHPLERVKNPLKSL